MGPAMGGHGVYIGTSARVRRRAQATLSAPLGIDWRSASGLQIRACRVRVPRGLAMRVRRWGVVEQRSCPSARARRWCAVHAKAPSQLPRAPESRACKPTCEKCAHVRIGQRRHHGRHSSSSEHRCAHACWLLLEGSWQARTDARSATVHAYHLPRYRLRVSKSRPTAVQAVLAVYSCRKRGGTTAQLDSCSSAPGR